MDIESYRAFCLSLPGTEERLPFGPGALVFFVMDKMYALVDLDEFSMINLKCDPVKALELREQHEFVRPGYHMNKKHWNSIRMDIPGRPVPEAFLREWTLHSYGLVVSKLSKKNRELLDTTSGNNWG
ncbi:MmcQ/YjbR family DNA-binding protein [Balneolales bacterium ANBcel1]|nr:MmcQ/YjbR family DNA-binding protein [Balneolales bacterium ANBcel1]